MLLIPACVVYDDDDKSDEIETTDDIAEVCSENTPETVTLTVEFPETEPGCGGFGENGNLDAEDAVMTARTEQVESLDLGNVVLCDATYDFQPGDAESTEIYYDDYLYLAFDDVILASTYAETIEVFEVEENGFPIWDWESLKGYAIDFDAAETWCLGEDEGLASCEIPETQVEGAMTLDFDASLVEKLALRAVQTERLDYTFVTVGDNDPEVDCYHTDFSFEVEVSYVAQ